MEKEYLTILIEKKKKNYYIKHNKTLCNLDVYYLPQLLNILQVKQNNIIYFQPFSIVRIKVQDTSIFSTSISNVTYTLPQRTFLATSNLESNQRNDMHNLPL